MRILIFTDTLSLGGKQRRIMELIQYLIQQPGYELAIVTTDDDVHFKYVYEFGIPIKVIKRKYLKYDPLLFLKFYRYCNSYKPDIIHTWDKMTTFYALLAKLINKTPIVSNLISDSNKREKKWTFDSIFFSIDIYFSDIILANSHAGILAYNCLNPKTKVIYNGVNLERFNQKIDAKKVREELGVKTVYMLIMVASFSDFKNYNLFIDVAKELGRIRDDVTFVGVGDGPNFSKIKKRIKDENVSNVILTGKQDHVEQVISASDLGILCTYSEGISNSIIEYMALGKPVITTDTTGGSKEIIIEGETGFCTEPSTEKIIALIILLLNDAKLRVSMGEKGKERINSNFSIERMGKDFDFVYKEVLVQKNIFQEIKNIKHNTKGLVFIISFRLCNYLTKNWFLRIIGIPFRLLYKLNIQWLLGIDIPDTTKIDFGFQVMHGQGLAINGETIIGRNVLVRQNTTIGNARKDGGCPIIGDNVEIGANSVIIGEISIGKNSIIAAGSVVVKDVPEYVIVAGNPAKTIKSIKNEDSYYSS